MRIVRVSGCHDCPYAYFEEVTIPENTYSNWRCKKLISMRINNCINDSVKLKTLPDNCPLEEVMQIITKARVEEVHGSAK